MLRLAARGIRRIASATLVAALAMGGLAAFQAAAAPAALAAGETGADTFTNPLEPDTADPTIEFHDGDYYLVATTWDNKVVMRTAPTLAALGTAKPVVVYSDTNAGRNGNMWAPELKRLEGPNGWRWYLMYTMGVAGNYGTQHLQVIESAADDPMGPYTYKGRPIPTDEWNIDGSYLELNGELFAVWSQFAPDGLQSNYIARMSDPWTAVGPLNLLSQPVEPWEVIGQPVNEGPIALQHDGRTWITYSASFCGTEDYQLGTLEYLGGDPVLQTSWRKSDGPVFSKANGAYGTGHNDFFTSPDGTETWNLYHANARPEGGCSRERSARAQIVNWDASGEPDFGIPQATSTPLAVPSGENAPITAQLEGARWNLVSRSTGLCATVASAEDGAALVQGDCASSRSRFVLDSTGDGYLRVVNAISGRALGPVDCATTQGAAVEQTPFVTTGCQQWTVAPTTAGWSSLVSRTSGKALEAAAGAAGAAGAVVVQATPDGAASQDWALRPAGAVTVTSIASGKALEVPGCTTADGAILQQREYTGTACQSATFTAAANGESEIRLGSAPEKCLAVTGGSSADSATVTQGACGVAGGTWRLVVSNDGVVEFRNGTSGKALDLSYCATADGTRVHQYSVLNNDCQRYRLASVAADPAPPVAVAATATTRCVAGKVVVATTVRNADGVALEATATSAFGVKPFSLGPGESASAAFATRAKAVAAGQVTIAANDPADAGRAAAVAAQYDATSC